MTPIDEESLFVDTWLMSCRVLKRGMELFTLNRMVEIAKAKGYRRIIGEYLPTLKNGMVEGHYISLGFKKMVESTTARYELSLLDYVPKECYISVCQQK